MKLQGMGCLLPYEISVFACKPVLQLQLERNGPMVSVDFKHNFWLNTSGFESISKDHPELCVIEAAFSTLREHEDALVYSYGLCTLPFKVESDLEDILLFYNEYDVATLMLTCKPRRALTL